MSEGQDHFVHLCNGFRTSVSWRIVLSPLYTPLKRSWESREGPSERRIGRVGELDKSCSFVSCPRRIIPCHTLVVVWSLTWVVASRLVELPGEKAGPGHDSGLGHRLRE